MSLHLVANSFNIFSKIILLLPWHCEFCEIFSLVEGLSLDYLFRNPPQMPSASRRRLWKMSVDCVECRSVKAFVQFNLFFFPEPAILSSGIVVMMRIRQLRYSLSSQNSTILRGNSILTVKSFTQKRRSDLIDTHAYLTKHGKNTTFDVYSKREREIL